MSALKIPSIIGHRGAAAFAPENTIESIRTAADIGAKWVELDVKLTKDSVPIIFHDDNLERTTSGYGPVAEANWTDIKELEAGLWFSEGMTGISVPSLEEALEEILKLKLGVNLEIKPCPGREIETAEVMLDLLSQSWDDTSSLLISSFSHVSLETAFDMAPDLHRGFLLEDEWPENWKDLADYLQISSINFNGNTASREQVEELMEMQKPLCAYTINDVQTAKRLRQWGVDSFFTDDPETVNESLFRSH